MNRYKLCAAKVKMDDPKTKKQGHKGSKEKRNGGNRLGSGKGTRVKEQNQARKKK